MLDGLLDLDGLDGEQRVLGQADYSPSPLRAIVR